MTIQTKINDGNRTIIAVYRNVIRGVDLAEHREGFLAQRHTNKWGVMIQLKGNERIVLARFGKEQA